MPSANGRNVLVFLAISPPQPWLCFFCKEDVEVKIESPGRGGHGKSPTLHHVDGDHDNDDPSNWAWAHHSCHTRHHKKGIPKTAEHRAKISAASTGKPKTTGHAKAVALGASVQQKSGDRYQCGECPLVSTPQGLGGHQHSSGHKGRRRQGVKLVSNTRGG